MKYSYSAKASNLGGPQVVTSLLVTISKVEVHLAHIGLPGSNNEVAASASPTLTLGNHKGNLFRPTNQEVNKWETLNIGTPQTLDLVKLANSHISTLLGNTKLVNGKYTEVRLYISSASATLQSGTQVNLVIPGRGNTVRVVHSFGVDSGKKTSLTMDFDAQNSVIQAGTQYILNSRLL
ncbi:MAG: DUF4382 domain-containing protein [Candidatus Levyibacteriota bacterium]